METPESWKRPKLPLLYTPAVLFWAAILVLLVGTLVVIYSLWLFDGINDLAGLVARGVSETSKYITPLIFTVVPAFLLLAFIRSLLARPDFSGIRLRPGDLPALEQLVASTAVETGITDSTSLYLTMDFNAAAFSGGALSRAADGNKQSLFIGLPALLVTSPDEMHSILLHEFGHLALRRRIFAVDLCNRIIAFVPRYYLAHRHGTGWAWLVTLVPTIFLYIYWRAFYTTMRYFGRQEELLVDGMAARIVTPHVFAGALTQFAVLQIALCANAPGKEPLLTGINASFYDQILSGADAANWIATAKASLEDRHWELLRAVAQARETVRNEPRRSRGTHPSLRSRIESFGLDPDAFISTAEYPGPLDNLWNLTDAKPLSSLVGEMRHSFYEAKRRSANPTIDRPGHSVSGEFICTNSLCSSFGRPEMRIDAGGIRFYDSAGTENVYQWTQIKSAEIAKPTNSFLVEMGRDLLAGIRDAPSNSPLILKLYSGQTIVVPHWHLGPAVPEAEALLEFFLSQPRTVSTLGADPIPMNITPKLSARGVFLAVGFVGLFLVVCTALLINLGPRVGSGFQTLLMIAVVSWVMARRK